MTTIKHDLDREEWLQSIGVDATHLPGSFDAALELLIETKLAAEQTPSIGNCRAYVAAHDAFWAKVAPLLEGAAA